MERAIRDAAVTALTGLPLTGARVFASRVRPLALDHGATLLVYTPSQTSQRRAMRGDVYQRTISLMVEGVIQSVANPDDALSALADSIETALHAAPGLKAISHRLDLTGRRTLIEGGDEDRHRGRVLVEFDVLTASAVGAPETFVS